MTSRAKAFEELCQIMHRLRSPGGCPWDREQTHSSLIKYLIEEAYEVADAIERGDDRELADELGDVLLQVVFHSEIAEEEQRFDIETVLSSICEKMIQRHPHVFGQAEADTSDAVLQQWEAIKRGERGEEASTLMGVPKSLPALLRAQRLQARASQTGFDWDAEVEIREKINEEVEELLRALDSGDKDLVAEEIGDLFFALVNWARFNGIEAEEALQKTNRKFVRRFEHIETRLRQRGSDVSQADLSEMDDLWEEAKRIEGGR